MAESDQRPALKVPHLASCLISPCPSWTPQSFSQSTLKDIVLPPPTIQVWNAAPVSGSQRTTPRAFSPSLVKATFPILPSGSTWYQGQGWIGISNSPHLESNENVTDWHEARSVLATRDTEVKNPFDFGGKRLRSAPLSPLSCVVAMADKGRAERRQPRDERCRLGHGAAAAEVHRPPATADNGPGDAPVRLDRRVAEVHGPMAAVRGGAALPRRSRPRGCARLLFPSRSWDSSFFSGRA